MRRVVVPVIVSALLAVGLWLAPNGTHAGAAMVEGTDFPYGPLVTDIVQPVETDLNIAGRGTSIQLSPTFPPPTFVPANSGTGRRAVYSKVQQKVWVVEADGSVVREFRVSGRLDMPAPGTYHVWSHSVYTCSIDHPGVCMRFMVRFAWGLHGGNIGFHEIPVQKGVPLQTEEQLGQPISDGCLREATQDAWFMWQWATLGTTVVVID